MVIFSSDHSSSSSEEDSKTSRPQMKIYAAEARAKRDRSLNDAKEIINADDEKLATYRQKRHQLQQTRLAAEDEVRSHADGVASDSDPEEVESVWEPVEREVKPYPPSMRAERLARADFRAEYEEDEYLDAMYVDPEDHLEEVLSEDDGSDEKLDEDSTGDDREDNDESDDSDD
ncbi:uncharacterized protein LOC113312745 [Papaver somniferum]|uniref:uncharacterized protein LOC113312745 n=1 Tax=Papaver somniferum TaxID=3469 RepID=UPI000E6F6E6C|nr:uncharacterized protein LOC113312745 [Papaver somniferum]